jgi:hypothetical protein
MRKALTAVAFVLAAASSFAGGQPECRAQGRTFNVSFPTFQIPSGERIVGFEVTVKAADVVGLAHIPKGWSIKLDSDKPTRKVSASIHHGSEAIQTVADLPTLAIVVTDPAAGQSQLELEGIVYTSGDFETYVRHRFRCSELIRGDGAP